MIELEWSTASIIDDYDEPDRFVYPYYGDIIYAEEDNSRTKIGKFSAQLIDVFNAITDGESIFDILDSYSSSMSEYYEPIFGDNSPNFSDAVELISDDCIEGFNLLIIDRIEILPKFRRKRLGLKVIRHMMTRFSTGAGIIALKAFPLQFENTEPPIVQSPRDLPWKFENTSLIPHAPKALPLQFENTDPIDQANEDWRNSLCLDCFVADKSQSTASLKKYYARLGFKSIPNTDFMVFPTGKKIPKNSRKKTNN